MSLQVTDRSFACHLRRSSPLMSKSGWQKTPVQHALRVVNYISSRARVTFSSHQRWPSVGTFTLTTFHSFVTFATTCTKILQYCFITNQLYIIIIKKYLSLGQYTRLSLNQIECNQIAIAANFKLDTASKPLSHYCTLNKILCVKIFSFKITDQKVSQVNEDSFPVPGSEIKKKNKKL